MRASVPRNTVLVISALTMTVTICRGEAFDPQQRPILLVGASWVNGSTPFNDQLAAPFGGVAVNFGSYLGLGDALVSIGQFVVNEAQSGGTTFDSQFCLPDFCLSARWQGYRTQFRKAVARVAIPNPTNPTEAVGYNATYVVIAPGNDCLHSAAFGIPQNQATPCTAAQVMAYIDRVIEVANEARARGLTPIFPLYPPYGSLDLRLFQQILGLVFVASEQQYATLAATWAERLANEVPDAIVVDAWDRFEHLGDGLHPTAKTSIKAATRIVQAIHSFEQRH